MSLAEFIYFLVFYSQPEFQVHQKTLLAVLLNSIRIAILPL